MSKLYDKNYLQQEKIGSVCLQPIKILWLTFFPLNIHLLGEPHLFATLQNLLYHSNLKCMSHIGFEFHRDWSIQSKTTDINPKHQENVEF